MRGRELVAQALHMRFQKGADLVVEKRQGPKFCLRGSPNWDRGPHAEGGARLPGLHEVQRREQICSLRNGELAPREAVCFVLLGPVPASPIGRLPRFEKWRSRP